MKTHSWLAALPGAMLATTPAVPAAENEGDEHHGIEEIVVTATPIERTVEQLAQPTSVLTGDALIREQATSIGETLADQPGVSASYFGPAASRPVIRGQFGERVRVLSNGLDALDASALSEDHAVGVDSILADRIEIVRGPATLLYGSGAAGGLVNVVDSRIQDSPPDSAISGTVALAGDTAVGERRGAFKVDAVAANAIFHVDYFHRDTDDVEISGFAESAAQRALEGVADADADFGVVENSASSSEGGAAAITLTGSRGYTGISVGRYQNDYGVPGHGHEETPGVEEEAVSIDLDQVRYDLDGAIEFDGPLQSIRYRVARNDYRHTEFEGAETGTRFDTQGTDARIEIRHAPAGRFDGAFGVQYKRIDFVAEGDEAFVPSSDTERLSLFAFEEYAVSDRWALQASARAEHQEITAPGLPGYDDTAYGISLGSVWTLSDTLRASANVALTQRHPNATELYANGPHAAVQRFERGAVALGNTLDKEMSTNVDLSMSLKLERLDFTLTAFVNDVDDYILLTPTTDVADGLPVFEFGQTDVDMYGFEAQAMIEIADFGASHLHARLTSDIVYAEEAATGRDLPRIPPLRVGAALHYTRGPLDASVSATWHDDQDRVAANELPTDAYTMFDAEIAWRLQDGDMLIYLKGTNLADEEARRHASPLKDLVPLPGRALHAGLRWDFG